jgi:alpha-galactosidase
MTHILENPFFQLALEMGRATWSVHLKAGDLALRDARMAVHYRRDRARQVALQDWRGGQLSEPRLVSSPQGPMRQIDLLVGLDANGLRIGLSFALPEDHPFLLWRIAIHNDGSHPLFVERLTLLDTQNAAYASRLTRLAFFSNGWQSWSHTGAYGSEDRPRRTRLGPVTAPMWVNAGTPQPARSGRFASDLFGVLGDRVQRTGLLAGFLSQQEHFGSLEARLDGSRPVLRLWANGDGARLDPGQSQTTDWACLRFLNLDEPEPLASYLEAVARQHGVSGSQFLTPNLPSSGWCSWYHFFQQVTSEDVRRNIQTITGLRDALPLEIIQIDDGFEAAVGDWFSFSSGFSGGVAPLAQEIRLAGFTPGLWLAPFIVHPRSRLIQEHPDWLLRGRFNRPVNAGYVWDVFTSALDLTHPEALDYATRAVGTAAHEWGFPYLKLDFLYAAALPGCYRDPTKTRAQVRRLGLEALRQAAGEETFLLGCGCPLGSAVGLVDAMRIGADVGVRWRPSHWGIETFFQAEPGFPSARNAIQNALTRLPLHQRWWINDPDCLLLRPTTLLTLAEVQSLATVVALSGGLLLLSDDLPALPPERLRIAQALLPLIGQKPRLIDWFDSPTPRRLRLDLQGVTGAWHLLALFNWQDNPQDLTLHLEDFSLEPGADYRASEFWSGELRQILHREAEFKGVPAHGVILLAVRKATPGQPQYLGGNLHISQGLEVWRWDWAEGRGALEVGLERPGHAQGEIVISLPRPPRQARLNGQPIVWKDCGGGVYRLEVAFERRALLTIES